MYDATHYVSSVAELAETLIAAVDLAEIGVTVLRQRGGTMERVYSSRGLCALTEYTPAELAALPPTALAAPSELPRMVGLREAILGNGDLPPPRMETTIITRTGALVPVELTVSSVRGPDGAFAVMFFRDLREPRRIEASLRESEARFRALAEASLDSITVIAQGRFLYANPATAEVLGFDSVAEFLERPLSQLLIDAEETAEMRSRLGRVAAGERLPPREYAGRRKDGSVAVMEISSSPIHYDGTPAILAIGRDTSERRALHAELMRADRLATLGMLAAGVAHEINNPLTYTLLHLERLALTLPQLVPDPAARKKVETMLAEAREGGDRVRTMVRELLSVARHDQTASANPVEPAIDTAIRLAGPTIGGRAKVSRRGVPVRAVRANPARLSQVFLNLVLNASDAFDGIDERNRVEIDVAEEGDEIVVTVRDNGRGIPPDVLARVFEPLFTTKPVGAGTGLGLWICRRIVGEVGGSLSASSDVGVGTQMIVRLPAVT